jgi:hypothetical protein
MKPAIVWRNPDPRWRKQRWQALERRLDRTLYIIQELVRSGDSGQWVTTFAFEVVLGGRKPRVNDLLPLAMGVSK